MVIKHDVPHATSPANEAAHPERDGDLVPETDPTGYRIREQPYGTKRHVRVILMGAGASTVNFLKKAEEQMSNMKITVYEKNHDVRSPGLSFVLSFALQSGLRFPICNAH